MKNTKTFKIIIPIAAVIFLALIVYSVYAIYRLYQVSNANNPPKPSTTLQKFNSDSEFDSYAKELSKTSQEQKMGGMGGGLAESFAPMSSMKSSDSESGSITNVQEAAVDEGDIVKAYKDYLVILRRGRLFTIKVRDQNNPTLQPVSKIAAYPEGFTKSTWLDELLIYKDKVIVIGYTYEINATQVGLFDINDEGKITFRETYFIDSNDYYSSRNYTSRLYENKLIFYMPYYLFRGEGNKRVAALPQIKKWQKGDELSGGRDILKKTDIYKPIQDTKYPTLHTVAVCNLDNAQFSCEARAILGPYSRNFYVSGKAIYIWVSGDYFSEDDDTNNQVNAYVYQIMMSDQTARGLQAKGSPIDQFSFKEDDKGYLNVLVRSSRSSDMMWDPEFSSGKFALMRTPLSNFTNEPRLLSNNNYTMLPSPKGYSVQNRFVGDFLLYGSGSGWYEDKESENKVVIKNYTNKTDAAQLDITHSIDRIEALGNDGLIVGSDKKDLIFSSISLNNSPKVQDTYRIPNAIQGELRSHGFYFKETTKGAGILGLPVRLGGESYEHLYNQSAQIVYLGVSADRKFANLGSLSSGKVERENDDCKYSCTDWYGNSRPIFYASRIFALFGYELVEGNLTNNLIKESQRINFSSQ